MENGSILPQALNYMQKLRDYDLEHSSHPYLTSSTENGERNSLIVSLYHIGDTPTEIDAHTASDCNSTNLRSNLHRKLASIHSILHTKLLPHYQNHYSHTWFAGGEGITFGLHCSSNSEGEEEGKDSVPHLRAVVHYGPHPCDEYFAVAIVFQITKDLHKIHSVRTAATCWDADDGQILLIEGADTLPSWVDDDIGVTGMANRVFVVAGEIILLPPRFQSAYDCLKSAGCLTTREALSILIRYSTMIDTEPTFRKEMVLKELNEAVTRKIDPFCRVIQEGLKDVHVRKTLKEYIHTAAVVLPLNLALLIQQRPDLIPCAILTFCKLSPSGIADTSNKKSGGQRNDSSASKEELMPFENLVFTTITLSKTLYAMLLTAAGKMQPPIKIPKRYKSIELNRMKRQVASGDVFQYYRHALEAGVRLALGFEWLSQDNPVQQYDSSAPNYSAQGGVREQPKEDATVTLSTTENRMMCHHTRIDVEAGGDGEWIRKAWAAGPNLTRSENNISALVKCPVWYPEIAKGGIDPIQNPGKAISAHIRETFLRVQKEETTSKGILHKFPLPRICDVDSDSWIDMDSIEALENKMKNVTHNRNSKTKMPEDPSINGDVLLGTHKIEKNENNSQSHSSDNINAMLSGLQSFMKSDSGAEGIVMGAKGDAVNVDTNSYENKPNASGPKSILDKIHINRRVFIKTLYNSVSENSADKMCTKDDNELLQYFSRADLEVLGEEYSEMDDGMRCNTTENSDGLAKMRCLMNTMDEELIHHKLDRNCEDLHDLSDCDTPHLSPNDPIAEDFDILSNLMKSLEVQGGSSGPVTTILDQMGIGKPDCT